MKSRITIEVDFENNNLPVIHIISRPSDDVRDKLVSQFLQSLSHTSRWATITFDSEVGEGGCRWKISPITPDNIKGEIKIMQAVLEQLQSAQS